MIWLLHLIFNPLLLTRSFSLTRMLFKSQHISFMLTLRSKVIHPRLRNLPKRDRNQLYSKKIYILKLKIDIDQCGSLTFYLDWDRKEPLEDNPQISYKPREGKEWSISYCTCPHKCLWSEKVVIKFLFSSKGKKKLLATKWSHNMELRMKAYPALRPFCEQIWALVKSTIFTFALQNSGIVSFKRKFLKLYQ